MSSMAFVYVDPDNVNQDLIVAEVCGARPAVRIKPRLKVREAAHVLTARSKQARAARAAARIKHGHSQQESGDAAISTAASVEVTSDQVIVKESDTLPCSPAPVPVDQAEQALQDIALPAYVVPGAAADGRSNGAPLDVLFSQTNHPAAAQNGRPLAKQHRSSSAHPPPEFPQSLTMNQASPAVFSITSTDDNTNMSTLSMPPQLQLPTPRPARGSAAVPLALPGSDPLPQAEFSPPIGGPIFHAGMAQRHPTITTRYRAKRSSDTPKASPTAYTGVASSCGTLQGSTPLRTIPRLPSSLSSGAPAQGQQPMPSTITAVKPTSRPCPQISHWAPPLPHQSPFGVARYAVPAVGMPGPVQTAKANNAPCLRTPNDIKRSPGIDGSSACKNQYLQHGPVDPATAADCAAQLRAAALAQYILSTAPTLMPTVFGHMSADAVAQALPALASASGLLAASMARPADSSEGSNAADLLTQVRKKYPSLQIPADLITSAGNDTQQARCEHTAIFMIIQLNLERAASCAWFMF